MEIAMAIWLLRNQSSSWQYGAYQSAIKYGSIEHVPNQQAV